MKATSKSGKGKRKLLAVCCACGRDVIACHKKTSVCRECLELSERLAITFPKYAKPEINVHSVLRWAYRNSDGCSNYVSSYLANAVSLLLNDPTISIRFRREIFDINKTKDTP